MKFYKNVFFLSLSVAIAMVGLTGVTVAQDRERVVRSTGSQPTNLPPTQPTINRTQPLPSSRPTLTNDVVIVKPKPRPESLINRTGSSAPTNTAGAGYARRSAYSSATSVRLDNAIKERYGIRYRYGTSGPNTYDCSGFVWAAFQEAGIPFTRVSARSLWAQSEPVYGDDRFKFGTLVFLNGLGHMGIVADENGFYHASSSKGITYSPFKGYWEKRIVGFRKLVSDLPQESN